MNDCPKLEKDRQIQGVMTYWSGDSKVEAILGANSGVETIEL